MLMFQPLTRIHKIYILLYFHETNKTNWCEGAIFFFFNKTENLIYEEGANHFIVYTLDRMK
jgi:hypothetical protein